MNINKMEPVLSIEQPKNLSINLFHHQLASVYAMEWLEQYKIINKDNYTLCTTLGINADITGFGKTASMIALILRDKMSWDLDTNYVFEYIYGLSSHHVKKIYLEQYVKNNITLVLVGQSVVHQWNKEFSYTNLKVLTITTQKAARHTNVDNYDVVIIIPSMYNFLMERYREMAWKRFIFDEPSNIRVQGMRTIRAGFIWFVTATPQAICLRHKYCHNSFMKEIVCNYHEFERFREDITIKNDDNFVRRSFVMPATYHEYYVCHCPVYNTVHGLIGERLNDMIDAGNISGVIQELGGKKTDNIVELVRKRKEQELEEIQSKMRIWTLRNNPSRFQEWKKREEHVLTQIAELDKRFLEVLNSECPICRDSLIKPIMEPTCQNIFCGKCLLTWLQNKGTCPSCRTHIINDELVYILKNNEEKDVREEKEFITKENAIVQIISRNTLGQYIIFSDWDQSFESIRNVLKANNIDFSEVKGTANNRTKILDMFRNGEKKVIFLNSRYNGSGINLQETTDIILYHNMCEHTRQQIIGRANRIGRTKPLYVHHLTYNTD